MTEEKIKQGEELLKRLDHLKDEKKKWEKAVGFYRPEVKDRYDGRGSTYSIDDSFINFEEVKLLAIAKIIKRIDEVQREFDNL